MWIRTSFAQWLLSDVLPFKRRPKYQLPLLRKQSSNFEQGSDKRTSAQLLVMLDRQGTILVISSNSAVNYKQVDKYSWNNLVQRTLYSVKRLG
jgi:hypothetical protein